MGWLYTSESSTEGILGIKIITLGILLDFTIVQHVFVNTDLEVVQSPSFVPTFCDPKNCSMPGLPVTHHLPKFAPSSYLLHHWCHPAISSLDVFFSLCPQSFSVSGTFPMSWLFTSGDQNTGASASASVLLVGSGLFSFKVDWSDLLTVQGTLRSLLQHHSSKASVLWCSAFLYGPGLTTTCGRW